MLNFLQNNHILRYWRRYILLQDEQFVVGWARRLVIKHAIGWDKHFHILGRVSMSWCRWLLSTYLLVIDEFITSPLAHVDTVNICNFTGGANSSFLIFNILHTVWLTWLLNESHVRSVLILLQERAQLNMFFLSLEQRVKPTAYFKGRRALFAVWIVIELIQFVMGFLSRYACIRLHVELDDFAAHIFGKSSIDVLGGYQTLLAGLHLGCTVVEVWAYSLVS